MAEVICFYSEKGGSCKTTSVISLGYILKKKGFKVLFVDFDIQSSLSKRFDISENLIAKKGIKTTEDLFLDENIKADELVYRIDESISIIPSNPIIKETIMKMEQYDIISIPQKILKNYFANLPKNWVVLIDSIGAKHLLSISALMLSTKAITTLIPSYMGLSELEPSLNTIELRAKRNDGLPEKLGILLCSSKDNTGVAIQTRQYIEDKKDKYKTFVYKQIIRYSLDIPKSEFNKKDINNYLGNYTLKEVKFKTFSRKDLNNFESLDEKDQALEIFKRIYFPKKTTSDLILPNEINKFSISYTSTDKYLKIDKNVISIDEVPYGKYQCDINVDIINIEGQIIGKFVFTQNIVKNNVGYDYIQFAEQMLESIGDGICL